MNFRVEQITTIIIASADLACLLFHVFNQGIRMVAPSRFPHLFLQPA
jgi:hypothetical protein